MQRLAVLTGSPGAIGDAIARALLDVGYQVRHQPIAPGGVLSAAPGDVSRGLGRPLPAERSSVGPVPARGGRADLVVHLGVRTPRDLDERDRAEVESRAALSAAQMARDLGARRHVHVSTAAVYGQPRNLPCREGELKAPRTAHERVRWRAEQASWEAFRKGAPLVVLRPTIVYGPTLRGGPVRALALISLFNQRRRRIPIIRRGPVAHLVHLEDVARAVVHVADHPDDRAVVGRAFNVGDDAPLPLAEHLAPALAALGYEPGRVLPTLPRLTAALLWTVRHVPDRALLAAVNGRLARAWRRLADRTGMGGGLVPRVDREALHWMAADHYYDTSRLASLGWRPLHPISTGSVPETIRALVAGQLLPGSGGRALPAW